MHKRTIVMNYKKKKKTRIFSHCLCVIKARNIWTIKQEQRGVHFAVAFVHQRHCPFLRQTLCGFLLPSTPTESKKRMFGSCFQQLTKANAFFIFRLRSYSTSPNSQCHDSYNCTVVKPTAIYLFCKNSFSSFPLQFSFAHSPLSLHAASEVLSSCYDYYLLRCDVLTYVLVGGDASRIHCVR